MSAHHTWTPWRVLKKNRRRIVHGVHQHTVIANCYHDASKAKGLCARGGGPPTEVEAICNAERIVACVNACENINPEAVPDLLEALKEIMEAYESLGNWETEGPNRGDYLERVRKCNQSHEAAAAAIAKAEGGAA